MAMTKGKTLADNEAQAARIEPARAHRPRFARAPGSISRGYLLVGLSLPRQNQAFAGLPLDDRLKKTGQGPHCMIQVIDVKRGAAAHSIELGGVVRELYDITSIPNFRTPMVIGFAQNQINRLIQRGAPVSVAELLDERTRQSAGPLRPARTATGTKKRPRKVKS
jgi:Domain of unknown function (DUF4915)